MKTGQVLVGTMFTISWNVIVCIFLGGAHNPGACKAVRSSSQLPSACTVNDEEDGEEVVMEEETNVGNKDQEEWLKIFFHCFIGLFTPTHTFLLS